MASRCCGLTSSVPPKKLAHLAAVVPKGRKTVTPKRVAPLAAIAAKGGSTVTEKKREHMRKALATRLAKARGETGAGTTSQTVPHQPREGCPTRFSASLIAVTTICVTRRHLIWPPLGRLTM
jgi:hypothetical protein